MADLKISQFVDGGAIQSTDEIATNRAGINTKVFVGSAAALDAGSGVGDVIAWQDDGSGNPVYPSGNGENITDIQASNVIYDNSDSGLSSFNVQDAIDEVYNFSFKHVPPEQLIGVPTSYNFVAQPEIQPDNITLTRNSAAVRINTFGLLEEMDADILRHQYDPISKEYLGVLTERQMAQLASAPIDSDNWFTFGDTSFSNKTELAPDGTNTATRVYTSNASGTGNHGFRNTTTLAVNVASQQGVYLKYESGDTTSVVVRQTTGDNTTNLNQATVDLITGEADNSAFTVTKHPDGWWNIKTPLDTPTAGAGSKIVIYTSIGAQARTGYIHAWGFNATEGLLSSFVPTASTRSPDNLGTTLPEAIDKGTMYWEGIPLAYHSSSTSLNYLVTVGVSTLVDCAGIRTANNGALTFIVFVGSTSYEITTPNGTAPLGIPLKAALTFEAGQAIGYLNGVAYPLSSNPPSINPMQNLYGGGYGHATNINNIITDSIRLWPVALNEQQGSIITRLA